MRIVLPGAPVSFGLPSLSISLRNTFLKHFLERHSSTFPRFAASPMSGQMFPGEVFLSFAVSKYAFAALQFQAITQIP